MADSTPVYPPGPCDRPDTECAALCGKQWDCAVWSVPTAARRTTACAAS
jgi:hypothetical protein